MKIALVTRGLRKKKLNEIIRVLNALMNMLVSPTGSGNFQMGDGNSVLTLGSRSGGGSGSMTFRIVIDGAATDVEISGASLA